jgi:hypothetical protein
MKDGEWCKLECNAGFAPIGDLLCNNGVLDGIIMCLNEADAKDAEPVEMMSSAFALVVDLTGMTADDILSLFTGVIAATLGVSESDVAKVDIADSSGRRLALQRRLQSGYEVAYQAIIPAGTDPAAIAAKASGIGSGGASQAALLDAFKAAGRPVDASSLKVTKAPKTFTATIVRKGGKPLAPSPPPIPTVPPSSAVTPAPPPPPPPPPPPSGTGTGGATTKTAEEEDDNTGAIVGGIVGGLVALLIIGGAAYYFLVVKKKQTE